MYQNPVLQSDFSSGSFSQGPMDPHPQWRRVGDASHQQPLTPALTPHGVTESNNVERDTISPYVQLRQPESTLTPVESVKIFSSPSKATRIPHLRLKKSMIGRSQRTLVPFNQKHILKSPPLQKGGRGESTPRSSDFFPESVFFPRRNLRGD